MGLNTLSAIVVVIVASLNSLNVHARKRARTYGTVMKYMPHLVHLYCGVFGSNDRASRPTKGGTQAAAMMYMRRFCTFLV